MRSQQISIPARKKNLETYMSLVLAIGQFEVDFASNWQKSLIFLSNQGGIRTTNYHEFDKKTKDFCQLKAKSTSN